MNDRAIDSNEEIYHRVRLSDVSYNCEQAAVDYFGLIAHLCPDKEDIAHSLLRLAMRMVFYLPIAGFEDLLDFIVCINRGRPSFLKWLKENREMLALIYKELTICCFFYDLRYDDEKKIVILDHKVDEEMAYVFVEIQDRNIYKEFPSFSDFEEYFHSFFDAYGLAKDEIDRLILEEGYKATFFST